MECIRCSCNRPGAPARIAAIVCQEKHDMAEPPRGVAARERVGRARNPVSSSIDGRAFRCGACDGARTMHAQSRGAAFPPCRAI